VPVKFVIELPSSFVDVELVRCFVFLFDFMLCLCDLIDFGQVFSQAQVNLKANLIKLKFKRACSSAASRLIFHRPNPTASQSTPVGVQAWARGGYGGRDQQFRYYLHSGVIVGVLGWGPTSNRCPAIESCGTWGVTRRTCGVLTPNGLTYSTATGPICTTP